MTKVALPRDFEACGLASGVKAGGREDLALFFSRRPSAAAAVMTRNRVKGAPLIVTREHLRTGRARAVVVNTGIANVCTGDRGIEDAKQMARAAAEALGVRQREVLVASTGIIGVYLPMEKITAGIRKAASALAPDGAESAARAIMTTDTVPKSAAETCTIGRKPVVLWGAAKGSGMIHPRMATMLAFVLTDAALAPRVLRHLLRRAVDATFNRITVDGDMSTSDMAIALANGAAGAPAIEAVDSPACRTFAKALNRLCETLAGMLVRDGEGATRLIRIEVDGAPTAAEAETIARGIATGNLVKTAIAGGDPNWGRILARVGQYSRRARLDRMELFLGSLRVFARGMAVPCPVGEAKKAVRGKNVLVRVRLHDGKAAARYLTCDLTHEYIRINAEYHT